MRPDKLFITALIIVISACMFSCKTRKVQKESSTVSKQQVNKQEFAVKDSSKVKTSDNSTETSKTITAAKNTEKSNTVFEADSIVTTIDKKGTKKTVIYPKGPVNHSFEGTGDQNINEEVNRVKDINTEASAGHDSSGSKSKEIKQDSTGTIKNVDAKGSGTTWATLVPIIGGIVLIIAIVALYVYLRKK